MIVREGHNITLTCAATGSPEPVITWRRERNKPLLSIGSEEGKIIIFKFQTLIFFIFFFTLKSKNIITQE